MRYSGSPLPISFAEAGHAKEVLCVEFINKQITVQGLKIPCFQELKQIRGDWEYIFNEVSKEKAAGSQAFLELVYTGSEFIDHKLRDDLERCIEGSSLEILKINNERKRARIIAEGEQSASLDDLQPLDIFRCILGEAQILETDHAELIACFQEIVNAVADEDLNRD